MYSGKDLGCGKKEDQGHLPHCYQALTLDWLHQHCRHSPMAGKAEVAPTTLSAGGRAAGRGALVSEGVPVFAALPATACGRAKGCTCIQQTLSMRDQRQDARKPGMLWLFTGD
jgi:hypothetical protein